MCALRYMILIWKVNSPRIRLLIFESLLEMRFSSRWPMFLFLCVPQPHQGCHSEYMPNTAQFYSLQDWDKRHLQKIRCFSDGVRGSEKEWDGFGWRPANVTRRRAWKWGSEVGITSSQEATGNWRKSRRTPKSQYTIIVKQNWALNRRTECV